MNNEIIFKVVYFGLLLLCIIIGVFAVIVGQSRFRFDFSYEDLKRIQKRCKKGMIIYCLAALLLPVTLIPLYIASPKFILIIQFVVLFFTISFSLTFMAFFLRYWMIRKKLRTIVSTN